MKFTLKRIKSVVVPKSTLAPDYQAFFRTPRGDFYVVGWLKDSSSDINLKIQKVDEKFLLNKFNRREYASWLGRNPQKRN